MDLHEMDAVRKNCTRFLTHGYPQSPQQVLAELAAMIDSDLEVDEDRYGQGTFINGFEKHIADLLGKEAAVFMPSGTMCQQIALRIWSERRGTKNVAFHPKCHLEIHEQFGYQHLHGLHGILVGSPDHLLTLAQLQAIPEPIGAVLLELPQREIGGQLPTWEELTTISDWAHDRGIPLHLDGARLWECQPFYERDYSTIAALFDSVYVSFYKVLGGIAGAVLAGSPDVIAEARIWQRRHGGNLIHLYPFVLAAHKGLDERLGQLKAYYTKAKDIAAALTPFPQIEIIPNPPQSNMMHLYVRGDADRLAANALDIAKETGVWLFYRLMPTVLPAYQKFELVVGNATLDLTNEEITELFQMLLRP